LFKKINWNIERRDQEKKSLNGGILEFSKGWHINGGEEREKKRKQRNGHYCQTVVNLETCAASFGRWCWDLLNITLESIVVVE
jgi:hypothetical protein